MRSVFSWGIVRRGRQVEPRLHAEQPKRCDHASSPGLMRRPFGRVVNRRSTAIPIRIISLCGYRRETSTVPEGAVGTSGPSLHGWEALGAQRLLPNRLGRLGRAVLQCYGRTNLGRRERREASCREPFEERGDDGNIGRAQPLGCGRSRDPRVRRKPARQDRVGYVLGRDGTDRCAIHLVNEPSRRWPDVILAGQDKPRSAGATRALYSSPT